MENQIIIPSQINNRNFGKSKFTVSKPPKLSKQPPSNVSLVSKVNLVVRRKQPDIVRKSNMPLTSASKAMPVSKIVMTDSSTLNKRTGKRRNPSPAKAKSKPDLLPRNTTEMAVQTNEAEILDHLLLVGDVKIMLPSKHVTDEIAKLRKEKCIKKLLLNTRRFEELSLKDEQHLDDLKEFLDKSFITRKPNKLRDITIEEDRCLIQSMDELLQRERPKTESITDIKSRIKQKEIELLSLFDNFHKKNEGFGITND